MVRQITDIHRAGDARWPEITPQEAWNSSRKCESIGRQFPGMAPPRALRKLRDRGCPIHAVPASAMNRS